MISGFIWSFQSRSSYSSREHMYTSKFVSFLCHALLVSPLILSLVFLLSLQVVLISLWLPSSSALTLNLWIYNNLEMPQNSVGNQVKHLEFRKEYISLDLTLPPGIVQQEEQPTLPAEIWRSNRSLTHCVAVERGL